MLERLATLAHGARKLSNDSDSFKRNAPERERERETKITREEERLYSTPSFAHDDVTKGDPRYIRATGRRHEL